MSNLNAIKMRLGLSAIHTAQSDADSGAAVIESRKETRVELRTAIEASEERVDQIRAELEDSNAQDDSPNFFDHPFRAIGRWFGRFFEGIDPSHHDETEEKTLGARRIDASIEHDQTKLEVLGAEQKASFDDVLATDGSMRDELSALEAFDDQFRELRSIA